MTVPPPPLKPRFFPTPADFRRWLARNHERERELVVGFYKKDSGRPSITWPESVDEAICFGWIDGVRRTVDESAYCIRFTPRKPTSNWSAVNVAKAEVLIAAGRMMPAGAAAYAARTPERTAVYSFESATAAKLTRDEERRFAANRRARAFYDAQTPWYRRTALYWVVSAKRPETRARRLEQLIADSAAGRTVPPLTRNGAAAKKQRG